MGELRARVNRHGRRKLTYERKKAEFTQSKSFPVGSPPRTSFGSPCRRALPKFDRSKSTGTP